MDMMIASYCRLIAGTDGRQLIADADGGERKSD